MFAATKCLVGKARNKDDALNSAVAGLAAGLAVGSRGRLPTALIGGVLAGAVAGLANSGSGIIPENQPVRICICVCIRLRSCVASLIESAGAPSQCQLTFPCSWSLPPRSPSLLRTSS